MIYTHYTERELEQELEAVDQFVEDFMHEGGQEIRQLPAGENRNKSVE